VIAVGGFLGHISSVMRRRSGVLILLGLALMLGLAMIWWAKIELVELGGFAGKEKVQEAGKASAAGVGEGVGGRPPGPEPEVMVVQLPPVVMSDEEAAFRAGLRPRSVPPKEPLIIPPGEQLNLSVKWRDELHARPNAAGQLELRSQVDLAAVTEVLRRYPQARFFRMQTATDEALNNLQRRAAERSGQAQPDLAGQVGIRVAGATRDQMVALAQDLHGLAEVEYAELESLDQPPPPPAVDIAPETPLLVGNQTYRQAAQGVNVDYVWQRYGIRGDASLRITDCEYDYNPNHEDLATLVTEQPNVVSRYTAFGSDHGTAVLGILASGWNAYGTTGSVPECATFFYPEFSQLTSGHQSRVACVVAAISASAAGDLVVLEMQADGPASGSTDYVPAEFTLGVWNAVRSGSDAGVITIAAAGNGNQNLDDMALFSGYHARGDSGAIIVGAGNASRAKLSFSTYGSRVNVQGWGTGVFTTGYGGFARYGGDPNQSYTATFSGTSSATPVVTSAAALVQSVAIKILGTRLGPEEMRDILIATGRAQTGSNATTAPIGPLPESEQAVESLLTQGPLTFPSYSGWGHYHFAQPDPDVWGDEDGDGYPNLMEYAFGLDPQGNPVEDADKLPQLRVESNENAEQTWVYEFHQLQGRTGVSWAVEFSESLAGGTWTTLEDEVNGVSILHEGDRVRVAVPVSAIAGGGFFRVRLE
jgi:hypothetical protein